jgi:Protein of unknown function (DUF3047)
MLNLRPVSVPAYRFTADRGCLSRLNRYYLRKRTEPAMKIVCLILLVLASLTAAHADELRLGNFSAGDLSGWQDETFREKAHTSYRLVTTDGRTVVQAESHHAASGLLKKVDLDPKKYPVLRWSWKIGHTLKREDVTKKGGDDFAARVYVVFPSLLFWRTRAINYVWSSHLPKNVPFPNPYTGNAIVLAVESGQEKVGTWVNERRNVYEDYKRAFGEEPPRIGAVAIMSDTDDTGDDVTAWYGDISLGSK